MPLKLLLKIVPKLSSHSGSLFTNPTNCGDLEAKLTKTTTSAVDFRIAKNILARVPFQAMMGILFCLSLLCATVCQIIDGHVDYTVVIG